MARAIWKGPFVEESLMKKVDKYKTDPKAKMLKDLQVGLRESLIEDFNFFFFQVINCCPKCTGVIEWKIKYGKYKTLSAPAKCVDCLQKTVKYNYHIRCGPCVEKVGKCAKCGEKVSCLILRFTSKASLAKLSQFVEPMIFYTFQIFTYISFIDIDDLSKSKYLYLV